MSWGFFVSAVVAATPFTFPDDDEVGAAVAAACRVTGDDPAAVFAGAPGCRARHYALHALEMIFYPRMPRERFALAAAVGANNPSGFWYTSHVGRHHWPGKWFSLASRDQVARAVRPFSRWGGADEVEFFAAARHAAAVATRAAYRRACDLEHEAQCARDAARRVREEDTESTPKAKLLELPRQRGDGAACARSHAEAPWGPMPPEIKMRRAEPLGVSVTAEFFGDPPPGRSALDQRAKS